MKFCEVSFENFTNTLIFLVEKFDVKVSHIYRQRISVFGHIISIYCRFRNVRENLIFTNIGIFVASRIQSSP